MELTRRWGSMRLALLCLATELNLEPFSGFLSASKTINIENNAHYILEMQCTNFLSLHGLKYLYH